MNFIKRLKFFLLGVIIGTLIIINIFGKRILFYDYFPNKRILKNLSKKDIIINNKYYYSLSNELKFYINPIFIKKKFFTKGKINFTKSLPRKKPFSIYQIHYKNEKNHKTYILYIENQPKKIIIKSIKSIINN